MEYLINCASTKKYAKILIVFHINGQHVLLKWLLLFFIHSKLTLLTQFPASNDEKYYYLKKNRHLQYEIIGLTEHLLGTILSNLVIFLLI